MEIRSQNQLGDWRAGYYTVRADFLVIAGPSPSVSLACAYVMVPWDAWHGRLQKWARAGQKAALAAGYPDEDGKPATFKDSFVRRLSGIFQPLDSFWSFGKKRQRMGDKFADTVVVELASEVEEIEPAETEEPEKLLDDAIVEMTNRLAEARQKVDASIGIEKQLQNAYEGALAQAERCEERAAIAIQAGREDLAREDLARRNEYRQLAQRYKTQWEEQQRIVSQLTVLLETLQQKTAETQRKRDVVIAQHRNVDAHEHLRQMLEEVQDNKASALLEEMEQDVSDASTLAKAAAEVDAEFSDAKRDREFAAYAEEASIDEELAELKTKFQHKPGRADAESERTR